jgi:taurine--2-oxoglutarate transaminase
MSTDHDLSGASAQEILDLCREYTLYEWGTQDSVNPIPFVRAKGNYLWDADGKRYLDFNSQAMCVNIGHADDRVIQAINDQVSALPYVVPAHATEARGRLGQELARISPPGLNKSYITLAGADANEAAVRIARLFTGKHKILTRYRSYHGSSQAVMFASGDFRRMPSEEGGAGVVRILDPYLYRSPLAVNEEDFVPAYMQYLDDVIQREGPETIAAILLEPITGTNGIIVPPDGWYQGIRELCDRYDILLIDDEVMAGFGRTGKWFAIEHEDVVPDIMTMAKGLTSAIVPLGAVIVNDRIAEHFEHNPLGHGITYGSHTVGCAAALATLSVYEEDNLIENAARMGELIQSEYGAMKERHPSIGDARGRGLFTVLELTADRSTKAPLMSVDPELTKRVDQFFRDEGMFVNVRADFIFGNPPLSITEDELRWALSIVDRALDMTDEAVRS